MDMLGPGSNPSASLRTHCLIQNQPSSLGDGSISGFLSENKCQIIPLSISLNGTILGKLVNLSLLSRNDQPQHRVSNWFLLQYPISTGRLPIYFSVTSVVKIHHQVLPPALSSDPTCLWSFEILGYPESAPGLISVHLSDGRAHVQIMAGSGL